MKKNIGSIGRIIRVGAAVVVALLIITDVLGGVAAIVLGVRDAVFVLTIVVSFGPLYLPFKISTTKRSL
jgi:hypothetical protein